MPISKTFEYGTLFEAFVINEIVRLNEYYRTRFELSHLRIDETDEIDLIIERPGKPPILLEIKSKLTPSEDDCATVQRLLASFKGSTGLCLHGGSERLKVGSVLCLNWREGIGEIFARRDN